jgi:hypothetical protein
VRDLLETIAMYHRGGLWHKDIKPSNLIVSGDRVHLVDLGLVTPLASAMTLTTHGTEYFRDPELVRLAMKGVKVHEVDGVKFDVYSAGAVLYSMVENSFPAHGSLSRISKTCPPALQWIIRRAMADLSTRYASAAEMGRDLARLLASGDPASVRPADLPSVFGAPFDGPESAPPTRSMREASLPSYADSAGAPGAGPVTAAAAAAGLQQRRAVPTGDRRVRRRTRRGVLAALGVTGMTTLMLGGALTLAHDRSARAPWRAASQERADNPRSRERAHATAQRATVTERVDSTSFGPLVPSAGKARGTVLLLVDLRLSARDERDLLGDVREVLEGSGLDVVSVDSPPAGGEQQAIEWTASARKTVGLAEPSDRVAVEFLEEWIANTPGLDGVLWVAPGSDDDRLEFRAIAPRR